MEANEESRQRYRSSIKGINSARLVYIDESGIDMSICQDRGWCLKQERLCGKKSGKYYERTNIIAGYVNHKLIAPLVFNGSCNTQLFEAWVEQLLLKELKPGQIVIMDNASFHKSQKIKKLIESVECKLLFLPPYSPDLNPIEKCWANMKRWIRNNISDSVKVHHAINQFFKLC